MMLSVMGGAVLAYAGMLGLCQGLERHFKPVWGRTCPPALRRSLRGMGWLGLLLSLLLCVQAWGWAMGPVAWFGVMSLAGLLLVLLLPYWPRVAAGLVGLVPVWGVMLVFAL